MIQLNIMNVTASRTIKELMCVVQQFYTECIFSLMILCYKSGVIRFIFMHETQMYIGDIRDYF